MCSAPLESSSVSLLERWYSGDAEALAELVERNLPWLRRYVGRRLDAGLRAFESTDDVVQDALIALLRQGPRFRPRDEGQFRALVAKVVLNHLRDLHDYTHAGKRDVGREMAEHWSRSRSGWAARTSLEPDRLAQSDEMRGNVQLALMLLDPEERRVIHWRDWDALDFSEIAARLGCSPDAARMRYNRAVAELGAHVRHVHEGRTETLERELEEGLRAGD